MKNIFIFANFIHIKHIKIKIMTTLREYYKKNGHV